MSRHQPQPWRAGRRGNRLQPDLGDRRDGDRPVALGFAGLLVREVLAAGQGTPKMQEISKAVQEGAAAYLNRQFRTLAVFSVIVFLLLVLPVNDGGTRVRIGRACSSSSGALFSARSATSA